MKSFDEALQRDPDDLSSLRGAIKSAHLLDIADESTADRIKSALIMERDPAWKEYIERQRARVDGRLSE